MDRQPVNPPQIDELDPAMQKNIVKAIEAARPIDDLLGWLIAKNPKANREWIFAALKAVYAADFSIAPVGQQAKTYRICREELSAYPQRLSWDIFERAFEKQALNINDTAYRYFILLKTSINRFVDEQKRVARSAP